jgi:hypothetical protein
MTIQSVNSTNNNNTPTTPSTTTTTQTASAQQVTNTQANIRRTQQQIKTYVTNLTEQPQSPTNSQKLVDIDGDGQVTEFDSKIIFSYLSGQRGAKLRDELSPYANSSADSIRQMETKIQGLITNKTLDVNNDGKVNLEDGVQLKNNFREIHKNKSSAVLKQNISEGKFDIDGNGVTNEKDIKLIRDHFMGGKTAAQIAQSLGTTANATTIAQKLTDISNNRAFDFNTDKKKNHQDIDNLSRAVKQFNKEKKANDKNLTDTTIRNLTTNKTIDTDGNNTVNQKDLDLLQAYMRGDRGSKLRRFIPQGGNQTQIETRLAGLISNRTVDVNKDGKIDHKDINLMRSQLGRNNRPR